MEHRITSLLLSAPEAGLEASCKELDNKRRIYASLQDKNSIGDYDHEQTAD